MDIVKLLAVFAVLIVAMRLGATLAISMACAIVATVVFYALPLPVAGAAMLRGATAKATIQALLVFYTITFLQRMMEDRHNLSHCDEALNGLFNNRRINIAVAPFMIGCLPAASAVLLCGPLVRKGAGDSLTPPEAAACTSYFRHISESFLPTYTSIYIAISLTNGAVSASSFVLAMLPMVLALFVSGWVVYLRRVPKDTGTIPDKPKSFYFKMLLSSIWPILLAIFLVLAFKIHVIISVLICIALNIFVARFSFSELKPFFVTAFEIKLMLNTWLVLIFKEVLEATGVVGRLPAIFSALPLPYLLIFALLFFFTTLVAGSQAPVVLVMPMMFAGLGDRGALSAFVLVMSVLYAAMQITPVHVCLSICAEDFKVSLGSLIAKTIPLVIVFLILLTVYFFALQAVGL